MVDLQNWDPRVEDFNDLNYSTVRGGPASNYVRQQHECRSQKGFALHIVNIPSMMSKDDLASHLTTKDIKVLDIICLPRKDSFKTNHAIVKVEDANQGLRLIEHFDRKPPLKLGISKALNQNQNSNSINDKIGGFQMINPTPLVNPMKRNTQNLRRPNKLYANNGVPEKSSSNSSESSKSVKPFISTDNASNHSNFTSMQQIEKATTISIESVKAKLDEKYNGTDIHSNDCKPKEQRQMLDSSIEVQMNNSSSNSICMSSEMISNKMKGKLKCIFCGDEGFLRCSICFAYYCSIMCQQDDWYSHQDRCRPPPILLNSCKRSKDTINNEPSMINHHSDLIQDNSASSMTSPRLIKSVATNECNGNITDKFVEINNFVNGTLKNSDETNEASGPTTPMKLHTDYRKFHFNKLKRFPLQIDTYIIKPVFLNNNLFVRLQTHKIDKEMNDFSKNSKLFFKQAVNMKPINLTPGELFCVTNEEGSYYRAQVVSIMENKVLTHYIDFGNTEQVHIDNARIFDSSFLDMPVACLQLTHLSCCSGVSSIREVYEKNSPLKMTVHSINPLTVDLKDDAGKLLLTSRLQKENIVTETVTTNNKSDLTNQNNIISDLPNPINIKSDLSNPIKIKSESQLATKNCNSPENVRTSAKLYKKTYEDTDCLRLPLAADKKVLVIYNNSMPIISVIPEADINLLGELEVMSEDIQKYCNDKIEKYYKPIANEVVLALYDKDEQWYRAAVLAVNADSASVIFVDYGNVETVKFSSFIPMLQEFMELPVLAVTCCVAGLPEQLSQGEKESLMNLVSTSDLFTIDIKSCEDFVYQVSIPSLRQDFEAITAKAKRT